MKLSALAATLEATLQGGEHDPEITGIAGIEEAEPGKITFVANPKYAALARTTRASAILVTPAFPEIPTPTLRLKDPYLAFARAIELFYTPPPTPPHIHPTAVISPTAKIGARAHIAAYVVIGDHVVLGDDAVLHPHVVLYPHVQAGHHLLAHAHAIVREHCRLGDHVILQNGAIIGADGYGFARIPAPSGEHAWHKIVQSGPAILEAHVEVQANACIDRASIGETRIGLGTKVDNLVQVGHGSSVGQNSLLCAQVGLAGSTSVGHNVTLAGQVGVAGHCHIGDGAIATAQSGLHGDIPPGKVMSGSPAIESRDWMRSIALFNRLPEIIRNLRSRT